MRGGLLMRLFALVFFICSNVFASMGGFAILEGARTISLSQASDMLDSGEVIFFDTNTQEVRENLGYIKNAVFFDIYDDKSWDSILPKQKDKTLVFYCLNRLCYEASEAVLKVQERGYTSAFVMIDGIEGWITSAREIEKKSIVDWHTAENIYDFNDGIHRDIVFGTMPSCRDCHGSTIKSNTSGNKGIKSANAADKMLINRNCVSCHDDLEESFENSVHNVNVKSLANHSLLSNSKSESGKKNPLCLDCHTTHTGSARGIYSPKQVSSDNCLECHKKEGKLYIATFHGKANKLNLPGVTPSVASCADCHGGHNVFKMDDFRSTLSSANRIETCSKCHPNSNANFVNYIAHADHTDKEANSTLYYTYVFMTGLLIFVFVFFGIHTAAWATRLLIIKSRNKEAWEKAKELAHKDKVTIKRFGMYHRIQHFFLALSFMGLSISGMPQKFYEAPWAQFFMDMMGGPINATKIHHFSAFVMGLIFFAHIVEIFVRAWNNRAAIKKDGKYSFKLFMRALFGPDSLMPRMQDFRDLRDNFKWFLGVGEKPQFDRWTYWEKFDYLAVFWGMFIIGFSGLVLWFPVFFTQFLPGWAINVAFIFHSDESLLAMGFIFAIHFFNTHFRPDRFPMDMVIFNGSITEQEITSERKKWYDRLKESNKLDKIKSENIDKGSETLSKVIGFGLMGLGVLLLLMIIYALVF